MNTVNVCYYNVWAWFVDLKLQKSFRNLKFDLLYKYIYTHKACNVKNLKFLTGLGFRQN